ncbi:MAG: hypothetical protein U1E76_14280 [Planctomycetota bacterium]
MNTLPPLPRFESAAWTWTRTRARRPRQTEFDVLPVAELQLHLWLFAIGLVALAILITVAVFHGHRTLFDPALLVWLLVPVPWCLTRLCWKYHVDADGFRIGRLLRRERVSWSQLWSAREMGWCLWVSYQPSRRRWRRFILLPSSLNAGDFRDLIHHHIDRRREELLERS